MVKTDLETEGRAFRPALIVGSGIVIVAVAIGLNMVLSERTPLPPDEPASVAGTQQPAPAPATPPVAEPGPTDAASKSAEPSFDVVRVEPSGAAVIAGRSAPGSHVVVKSGDATIGDVTANDRGEWVLTPAEPLTPGTHELTVERHGADGAVDTGDDVVVVVVPPPATAGGELVSGPLAVKTSRRAGVPSVVLQSGGGGPTAPIAVETVDIGSQGHVTISGRAPPQTPIRVYLDNTLLGETTADSAGLWRLKPPAVVSPGEHSLRADAVTDGGTVQARASVPLRVAGGVAVIGTPLPQPGVIVVERGQSLWRIARAVYGEGLAYTVIYDANRRQIANPDLIYPGQVFEVPKVQ